MITDTDEPTITQISTLLAALRFYQRNLRQGRIPLDILSIASNEGDVAPLTVEEIDELCERINE